MSAGRPEPGTAQAATSAESRRLRTGFLRLKGALFDRVTGLYSYHLHFDQLQARAEGRRIGVLVLDFPALGGLETAYGWEVCDRFLSGVAALLGALKGRGLPDTTLVALDGVYGNSFLLFVPEGAEGGEVAVSDLAGWARLMTHHLEARLREAEWAPPSSRVGFSLGYALVCGSPAARFERLVQQGIRDARTMTMRDADRVQGERAAELIVILREARLTTHYQPIVDFEQGTIMGYEALTRGPINTCLEVPEALFACSDRARLSTALDDLCRREAVRNARGFDTSKKLFLNSLPEALGAPGAVENGLRSIMEERAILPRNLVLEITERTAIEDFEAFGREMDRLRRQGFLVAIDDVGTGYSSLQTISEVQPDFIKVDISLVKNIHQSLIKQELVRSLLNVGSRIRAQVIAEGIETEEEYRAVRACGVRYGQGFFFARPAPTFGAPAGGDRGTA